MCTPGIVFKETSLKGAYIIDVEKQADNRGFSGFSFSRQAFEEKGLEAAIVQANINYSKRKGTVRGLHLQLAPFEETKCVRCARGALYDVIIDLRPGSPTYAQWTGVELTAENYRMLYVPKGFAHGYLTLEEETEAAYHVTQYYTPGYEIGIRWNDPAFAIQWPIAPLVVSEKDQSHPDFQLLHSFAKPVS